MTPLSLRQRMIDDMQLRGLSATTQRNYVAAVYQLAKHYHRSPDQITEEELRQYFIYLTKENILGSPFKYSAFNYFAFPQNFFEIPNVSFLI